MDQFMKVFDTKLQGFRNLLQATANDKLTHICCFSSVSARIGNVGQVDYAMANEILNKVLNFTLYYQCYNADCHLISTGRWINTHE